MWKQKGSKCYWLKKQITPFCIHPSMCKSFRKYIVFEVCYCIYLSILQWKYLSHGFLAGLDAKDVGKKRDDNSMAGLQTNYRLGVTLSLVCVILVSKLSQKGCVFYGAPVNYVQLPRLLDCHFVKTLAELLDLRVQQKLPALMVCLNHRILVTKSIADKLNIV